jgi:hypothetical protein
MPNQNGTGPFGDGRPGRGLGPCGRFGLTLFGGRNSNQTNFRGNAKGNRISGFGFWWNLIQSLITNKNDKRS